MTDDITLWTLSYQHAGLTYSVWLWGAREEVESHAGRLGWVVEGQVLRVVDEVPPEVYYEREDVQ